MATSMPITRRVPSNVIAACSMMIAGAAVALVLGTVQLLMRAGILQSGLEGSPAAPLSVNDFNQALLFVVTAVLCLWMSWKNFQGRTWAKTLTLVLGILILTSSMVAFVTLSSRLSVISTVAYGVSAILSTLTVVLVYRKDSNGFYTSRRNLEQHQRDDYSAQSRAGTYEETIKK